eukprot:scaffold8641_cov134-Isochrysis_galbana.AAC.15
MTTCRKATSCTHIVPRASRHARRVSTDASYRQLGRGGPRIASGDLVAGPSPKSGHGAAASSRIRSSCAGERQPCTSRSISQSAAEKSAGLRALPPLRRRRSSKRAKTCGSGERSAVEEGLRAEHAACGRRAHLRRRLHVDHDEGHRRVEPGRRLVAEQERRQRQQLARDAQPLALAARDAARGGGGRITDPGRLTGAEAERRDERGDPGGALGRRQVRQPERRAVPQRLADRQRRKHLIVLIDEGNAPLQAGAPALTADATVTDTAGADWAAA